MARLCVVGNATSDLNRSETRLFSARRPGGTLLYASLALHALGHLVTPVGYAPLRAYLWMRRAGLAMDRVRLAFPGTQFLNVYRGEERDQWARRGPRRALPPGAHLEGFEGVLLGPVLGEVTADAAVDDALVSLVDLQGVLRTAGPSNLLGWRRLQLHAGACPLPATSHVRGSLVEAAAFTGEQVATEAVRALHEATGVPAVVTLGSQGAVAYDGQLHRATPEPLEVADPTGAGDVFDAGFLHGMLGGKGLEDALATGCAAATLFLEGSWEQGPEDRFADAGRVADRAARISRAGSPG